MSKVVLGYDQNGRPIEEIKPGMIATCAVITCTRCKKVIRGMGGPMHGAYCPEHAPKRILLDKHYAAEELADAGRDIDEAFDDRFTPEAGGIPKDDLGFDRGRFRIQIIWEDDDGAAQRGA